MAQEKQPRAGKSGNPVRTNRNAKASVFEDLFSDKKNLLALYKVLHPEDTEARTADLKKISLKNILTKGIYNDLGFMVGNRLMILVEAQSTWTVNIIPRCIMYLAETWKRYFVSQKYDVYSASPVNIPEPELYVIYTGEKNIEKEAITLSDEFFGGKNIAIDATVKVLKYSGGTDIIDQYILFCQILDEQRKLHPGDDQTAIEETIRICTERNILKTYLQNRKKEVVNIMLTLFEQEQATEMMLANERKNAEELQAKKTAKNFYEMGESVEKIAKGVGYTVDTVRKWLDLQPA